MITQTVAMIAIKSEIILGLKIVILLMNKKRSPKKSHSFNILNVICFILLLHLTVSSVFARFHYILMP